MTTGSEVEVPALPPDQPLPPKIASRSVSSEPSEEKLSELCVCVCVCVCCVCVCGRGRGRACQD